MKKLIIISALLLPVIAEAQTGDAGSGWANWIMTKLEWVKQEIRDNEAIAKTAELIRVYRETKELTGVIASTVKDLSAATSKFQNDTRTVDLVTQSQLNQLNDFVSWDEAIKGQGYQPMTNMTDWYEDAFATIRSENGTWNITSWFASEMNLEEQVQHQRTYEASFLKIRGQKTLYIDHEIRRLFRLADEYDNQARHLVLKLNLSVFNKGLSNVSKGLGKVFTSEEKKDDKEKVKRSDEDVQAQLQQVYDLQDKAARARGEALEKLRQLMVEDMNASTVDLLSLRQMYLQRPKALPKIYKTDRFMLWENRQDW